MVQEIPQESSIIRERVVVVDSIIGKGSFNVSKKHAKELGFSLQCWLILWVKRLETTIVENKKNHIFYVSAHCCYSFGVRYIYICI